MGIMKLWEEDIPGYESVEEKFAPYMKPYILENDSPRGAVLVLLGAVVMEDVQTTRAVRLPCG